MVEATILSIVNVEEVLEKVLEVSVGALDVRILL